MLLSQIYLYHPKGFEPFKGSYGLANYCLQTTTITVPRLKLVPSWNNQTPVAQIARVRRSAVIWNPAPSAEARAVLTAFAEVSEIKHRIRRHAARDLDTLHTVLALMAYGRGVPMGQDPADRFEEYLQLRDATFLKDLLGLLDVPDKPNLAPPGLPRAA